MSQKEAFELAVKVLAKQPEEVKQMVDTLVTGAVTAAALNTVGLDSAEFWDKQRFAEALVSDESDNDMEMVLLRVEKGEQNDAQNSGEATEEAGY